MIAFKVFIDLSMKTSNTELGHLAKELITNSLTLWSLFSALIIGYIFAIIHIRIYNLIHFIWLFKYFKSLVCNIKN